MDAAGADLQHYAATTHTAAVAAATAVSSSAAAAVVATGSLYSPHQQLQLQQPSGLTCIARPDLRPLHLTTATTSAATQQQQHRQRVFSTAN